jgi:hypothetical protein
VKQIWKKGKKVESRSKKGKKKLKPIVLCIFLLLQVTVFVTADEERKKGGEAVQILLQVTHICFAEASEGQLDKVLECLTLFCSASGQRVSVEKTKMFFSKGLFILLLDHLVTRVGLLLLKTWANIWGSLFFINALPSKHMVTL